MSGREKRIRMTAGMLEDLVEGIRRNREDYAAVSARLEQLRHDTRRELRKQEERLQERIAGVEREFDRRVTAVEHDVAHLQQARARAEAQARRWISTASTEHTAIAETLPHRQFAPGGLDGPAEQINQAHGDVRNGNFDTAVSEARGAFRDLVGLRRQIEADHERWTALRAAARSALAEVAQLAAESRLVPGIDLDGAEMLERVNVDMFTGNGLTALRKRIDGHLAEVENTADPMTIAGLGELLSGTVDGLLTEVAELRATACAAAAGSQLRHSVAVAVLKQLIVQGHKIVEPGGYEEEDVRRSVVTDLVDGAGVPVVLRVEADPDNPQECQVVLIPEEHNDEPAEYHWARMNALSEQLRADGLPFDPPAPLEGEPGGPRRPHPGPGPSTNPGGAQ